MRTWQWTYTASCLPGNLTASDSMYAVKGNIVVLLNIFCWLTLFQISQLFNYSLMFEFSQRLRKFINSFFIGNDKYSKVCSTRKYNLWIKEFSGLAIMEIWISYNRKPEMFTFLVKIIVLKCMVVLDQGQNVSVSMRKEAVGFQQLDL